MSAFTLGKQRISDARGTVCVLIFRRIRASLKHPCGTQLGFVRVQCMWPKLSHALDILHELHRSAVAKKKKSWKHPATVYLHLKPS